MTCLRVVYSINRLIFYNYYRSLKKIIIIIIEHPWVFVHIHIYFFFFLKKRLLVYIFEQIVETWLVDCFVYLFLTLPSVVKKLIVLWYREMRRRNLYWKTYWGFNLGDLKILSHFFLSHFFFPYDFSAMER